MRYGMQKAAGFMSNQCIKCSGSERRQKAVAKGGENVYTCTITNQQTRYSTPLRTLCRATKGVTCMDKQSRTYQAYVQILKEELIPAMGCTEPIAIAYAAAKARDVLGGMPDKVEIGVSSNIIKNVKSVIVPNTDGMKGIEAAAAAGIVGGQADKALEVISAVTADQKAAMRAFLKQVPVTVKAIDNGFIFDIIVTLQQGSDSAVVRICQYHTNIVLIQRNSEVLLDHTAQETKQLCGDAAPAESGLTDRALLNIADIFAFADTCEINDIRPLLET